MVWAYTNPNTICLTLFISISSCFYFSLHSNINILLIVVCFCQRKVELRLSKKKEVQSYYEYLMISILETVSEEGKKHQLLRLLERFFVVRYVEKVKAKKSIGSTRTWWSRGRIEFIVDKLSRNHWRRRPRFQGCGC